MPQASPLKTTFFSSPLPRMFGHRGSSGEVPENTLLSFQTALEQGADYLEMDVHSTRDGHIVVSHDAHLERTSDGTGHISELTLAEIKRLDAGFHFSIDNGKTFPFRGKGITFPTLHEVAERFPEVPFNIEIKQKEPAIAQAVFDLLRELGHAQRVLLAAESDFFMEKIRSLDPGLPTNFASSEVLDFLQRLNTGHWDGYQPPGRALQVPEEYYGMQILSEEFLQAAHRFGIEVHIWTVNEEKDMRRLLKMRVDGIMTDYPRRLSKIVKQLGLRKGQ